MPTARRAITTNATASHTSNSAIFQSKPLLEDATGFGGASNCDETGFEAGDPAPTFEGWRRLIAGTTISRLYSYSAVTSPVLMPTDSRTPSSTEIAVARDGSAGICQDGSVTESAGSASRLAIATLQTSPLDAAEALRSVTASNPATDKITALLMKVSSNS